MFKRFIFFSLTLFTVCSYSHAVHVTVFSSSDVANEVAARKIADLIISHGKEKTVLGLATGNTWIPVYAILKKIIIDETIDLSNVITFNLDEYLGIPLSDEHSYHSYMFSNFFEELLYSELNPKGIKRENIHIPKADNWIEYESMIANEGPIDLQILGIGRNGHIGFAEPGTPFDSRTSIVELADTTRQDNAGPWHGDLEKVPQKAISMGIATILEAKEILLLAFGEKKAEAVSLSLNGPLSIKVPASALQKHPNTTFILDEKAAYLLKNSEVKRFVNTRILLDHSLKEGDLWVANGIVIPPQEFADIEYDMQGKIIAPGYIDLQINGAFGCDFSRDPEKVDAVAKKLLQYGVTAFLPTLVTSSPEQYKQALPRLQPRSYGTEGATILGIHLEGPFLAPVYKGAHNLQLVIPTIPPSVESIYGNLEGVKIVTLAPELPGALELIPKLKKKGILVSGGHTASTFEQMQEGINAGIGFATHIFNAMTPFHHRNSGVVGAILFNPSIPYSLIADGIHLSPETIMLCWRSNPKGLILVSDAIEALGLPEGRYKLGTSDVDVSGTQVCVAGTNKLAGSNLSLNRAVQIFQKMTQCTLVDALEAASLKPAQLINVYPCKGSLSIGADADFIVLNDDLEVQATYLSGSLAWEKGF